VEYEGPGIRRQIIPAKALFHSIVDREGGPRLEPGLNYWRYLGSWRILPEFSTLAPVKSGIVTNFDFSVREGATNVALLFTGEISVLVDSANAPLPPVFSHVRLHGIAYRLPSTPNDPGQIQFLVADATDIEILSTPNRNIAPQSKTIAEARRSVTGNSAATI